MSNRTGKNRIVGITVIVIGIIGLVYLWSTFLGKSKEQESNLDTTISSLPELQITKDQDEVNEKVNFSGRTAASSGMTMEVLSMEPKDDNVSVEVRWQMTDWRDWKISKASLNIDGQEYNYAGYDLVEGLFHYRDGSACHVSMNHDVVEKECSPAMIEEAPYRVDRLIFKDVPHDFLQKSVILKITEVNSIPNESQYCEELDVDTIAKLMQAEFPGIELECFQDPGMNWSRIAENTPYTNNDKAIDTFRQLVGEALQGRIAGIWKFDLSD
jgi:hypothetical protein